MSHHAGGKSGRGEGGGEGGEGGEGATSQLTLSAIPDATPTADGDATTNGEAAANGDAATSGDAPAPVTPTQASRSVRFAAAAAEASPAVFTAPSPSFTPSMSECSEERDARCNPDLASREEAAAPAARDAAMARVAAARLVDRM